MVKDEDVPINTAVTVHSLLGITLADRLNQNACGSQREMTILC